MPSTDGKRHRWAASSRDRHTVETLLDFKLRELGRNPNPPEALGRREHMIHARSLGTHTRAELVMLHRHRDATCRYCAVPLDIWNTSVDHKRSVARGGSDSIDNMQIICWQCNAEKGDRDADEFTYAGETPRPYAPLQSRGNLLTEYRPG